MADSAMRLDLERPQRSPVVSSRDNNQMLEIAGELEDIAQRISKNYP